VLDTPCEGASPPRFLLSSVQDQILLSLQGIPLPTAGTRGRRRRNEEGGGASEAENRFSLRCSFPLSLPPVVCRREEDGTVPLSFLSCGYTAPKSSRSGFPFSTLLSFPRWKSFSPPPASSVFFRNRRICWPRACLLCTFSRFLFKAASLIPALGRPAFFFCSLSPPRISAAFLGGACVFWLIF